LASVVVNVPYGGLFMPPAVLKRLPFPREELSWENFRLADPCLLSVLAKACEAGRVEGPLGGKEVPGRPLVSYSFSPLVADPLGFLAAELGGAEPAGGPEILASATSGKPLFGWSDSERSVVIRKSAEPYLADLRDRCRELLGRDSMVLLMTARSYAAIPWAFERDRRYPRPQLGIGSMDGRRTPKGLAEFIGRTFKTFNLWPELDWPHRGAYAPPELAGSPRLLCCTVSFRRDLYMDERTGALSPGAGGLARILRTVFSLLEEELDQVVKVRYRRKHPPKPPSMVIKASPAPEAG
jgi:hypothetical protein